jgi:uncharacterized protein
MSSNEEDFFAREEIEKKRKLALKQQDELAVKQREELQRLHHMKCPRCGLDLHTLTKGKLEIDTCFNCHGIWLDAGELEQLRNLNEQSGTWMGAVLNLFKRK